MPDRVRLGHALIPAPAPVVHAVSGPIDPATVGRVLMHEHLICDIYRVTGNLNHVLNDEALAIDELASLSRVGGTAVVECTTPDMGRNVAALLRIAAASGIHVIAGTGWYRQPFYPPEIDRRGVDDLAREMVTELTLGIGDTGACAGIIGEIGANLDYLTAQEERVLRAASRASMATGAPVTTHASMYPVGVEQLDVLEEEGVDPAKVIIGHADTFLDLGYHLRVLERGAYLAFDTVARNHMNPDERRATSLIRLLDAGWGERLLLSSDRCHRSDLRAFGGAGYGAVFGSFFELLRAHGADEDVLDLMTVVNPRRVLSW